MDFLDPKRKKAHHRRVLIGYLLMAVALAMATWLLLNSSFGYWVDPKTGDVVQNGTVFVDSEPGGSTVELDGVVQGNKTATRLALPGGRQYTIKLSQDGYEDWTRTFSLEGGSIERLTYPLLIPKKLTTSDLQLYAAAPALSSQSPDRHWLLAQQPGPALSFDVFDLTAPSASPATTTVPNNVLTEPAKASVITIIEWADDNHHVLIKRAYDNKQEFIVIDTENANAAVNLNVALGVTPSEVRLRDKKSDQFYLYSAEGGVLRSGDSKSRTISGPILSNVLAFKTYADNLILYATKEGADEGKVNYRIRENDKGTYLLTSIPSNTSYLMDIAEYDGTPFYVIGNEAANAAFVYRDPLPALKGQRTTPVQVMSVMRINAPRFISFSSSSQFIAVQSSEDITVLDLEGDRQFTLNLKHPAATATKIAWMDGHRFIFTDNNLSYMVDFDGSNVRPLVPSLLGGGPYFSPDYKTVFSFAPSSSVSGRFAFTQTSLVKK